MRNAIISTGIAMIWMSAGALAQTQSSALWVPEINGVYYAVQFPGSDAGASINACLLAAQTSGVGVCDASGFKGILPVAENMFAGMTTPFELILSPNASYQLSAKQIVVAPDSSVVTHHGSSLSNASFNADISGTLFDLKDAQGFKMQDIGIYGGNTGTTGIELNGGIADTWNIYFDRISVAYFTGTAIDNSSPSLFSVTMTNNGTTVTGTLASGTFPTNWIGQTAGQEIGISGASNSTFNYNYLTGGNSRYVSPVVIINSSTTFTISAGPSSGWSPAVASGVTATMGFYSGAQVWVCHTCQNEHNGTGYATIWATGIFEDGSFAEESGHGISAINGSDTVLSGVTFSSNGSDIYLAGNGASIQSTNDWFELSTNGIVTAASGVTGYNFQSANDILHSNTNLINVSSAGAGSIALTNDIINSVAPSPVFEGATGTTWSGTNAFSGSTQPSFTSGVFPNGRFNSVYVGTSTNPNLSENSNYLLLEGETYGGQIVNQANSAVIWSWDNSGNIFAGNGTNIVYRCTAPAAYVGFLTTTKGTGDTCTAGTDTGLRTK